MKLIDADNFKTRLEHEAWGRGHVELLRARDIADETPTVDAVPVIRCKDCLWHYGMICRRNNTMFWNDNDFCSRAERRES